MVSHRPLDAEAFRPTRPKERAPMGNAEKLGRNYEVFGGSLAGGQLVFAAFDGRQFDPPANVEEEQEGVSARSIENYPAMTYVAAIRSSGFAA